MALNNIYEIFVGADLSRTPQMYRPSWISRYPPYCVKNHYRPSLAFSDTSLHVL